MWKKSEDAQPSSPPPSPPPARARANATRQPATIGPSITVKGDLSGEEDLTIQGRLEGEIRLRKNNVTVGPSGRVKADIYGQSVHVEGEVRGNLYGETEVVIRASGQVQGNIVSPRVTLENGSKFKGSIDMEPSGRGDKKAAHAEPEKKAQAAPPAGAEKPEAKIGLKPAAPGVR